jgi:hypothetical protein
MTTGMKHSYEILITTDRLEGSKVTAGTIVLDGTRREWRLGRFVENRGRKAAGDYSGTGVEILIDGSDDWSMRDDADWICSGIVSSLQDRKHLNHSHSIKGNIDETNDSNWQATVEVDIPGGPDYFSFRLPKEITSVIHDYCAETIAKTAGNEPSTVSYVARKMFRIELDWAPLNGPKIESIKGIAVEPYVKQDGPFVI